MNSLAARRAAGWACILLLSLTGSPPASASGSKQGAALPDWSGWWVLQFFATNADALSRENPVSPFEVPPLQPAALARFTAALDAMLGGKDLHFRPNHYCQPFRYSGVGALQQDPEAAVEFLFTPGRVTITDESGRLRRIIMAGRTFATEPDETNTGTSLGHWEGQTLVVETRGLHSQAEYVAAGSGATLGKHAVSVQRIFLRRKDVLQIESVVTAPESLTRPYRIVHLYQRDPGHVPHEFSYCNDYDRQIDPQTGEQRFDLTPPADLPPPPG